MPEEIINTTIDKKMKKSPEELFSLRVDVFVSQSFKKANKIQTPSISMHINSIIEILGHYKLDSSVINPTGTLTKVKGILDSSIKEYKDFKKDALDKIDSVWNNTTLSEMEADIMAEEAGGTGNTFALDRKLNMTKNVIQRREDFKLADNVVDDILFFINSDPLLVRCENEHKIKQKKEKLTTIGTSILSAVTGSAFPSIIPSFLRDTKEKFKEFKGASKKGKTLMTGQALATGLGFLTGSPGALVGGSLLGQAANEEAQKNKNINETIKNNNKIIKLTTLKNDVRGGEFSLASLQSEDAQGAYTLVGDQQKNSSSIYNSFANSTTNNTTSLKPLDAGMKANLAAYTGTPFLAPYKQSLLDQGYRLNAKGGMFETKSPVAIGKDVFGEAGPEKLKAIGTDGDPAANELKTTNKLLEELLQTNNAILEENKNIAEDNAESKAREGLTKKRSSEPEKKTGILGSIGAKVDEKKKELTSIFDNLKSKALSKIPTGLLPKMAGGAVGGAVGGVGGYKAGGWLANKMGMEEGGTGEKIMKFGGGAIGGIGGAIAGSKLASKVPGLSSVLGSMTREGNPVYITNWSEMPSGGVGGIGDTLTDTFKGKGKTGVLSKAGNVLKGGATKVGGLASTGLSTLGGLSGGGAMMGAATLGAGAAAGFGIYDTYKAATTGKSKSNDVARSIGLVKSKEDIEKGLKWGEMGIIDKLASGASSVAGFVTGETSESEQKKKTEEANNKLKAAQERKALRESGGKGKPQDVIIKDDKSKQTAAQLLLAQKALKVADTTSIKADENKTIAAEKADENKTLTEKLTSIWSDPNKSLLSKAGGSISAGFGSIRESVGGIFKPKKSEFDISKLKEGTGSVAEKYESGGRGAGTISTGKGDFGGKSYGSHQLSSKSGTLQGYIKQSPYAKEFSGLKEGSAEFDTKWKDLAKNDPNFGKSQKDFIAKTHAAPQMDKLKKLGLNTDSKALQEMAFSTGVQYGPQSGIIEEAIKASGKDPSKLSTKEIISIVQDYKASSVRQKFKSSSGAVQQSVAQRHGVNEKADLLKIADAEANGTLPIANTKNPTVPNQNVVAKVKPKNVKEGSIANIKNNSAQGSEGGALKNKEVVTDTSLKVAGVKGTQQAINNISIGGNSTPAPPPPTPTIYTGDQVSYATRLAKSY